MLVSTMSLPSMPETPHDPNAPTVHVALSKPAYRPGDTLSATIDVDNLRGLEPKEDGSDWLEDSFREDRWSERRLSWQTSEGLAEAVVLEELVVELKGLERLDPSWIQVPKVSAGSTQPRGERTIVETSQKCIAKDVVIEQGGSRTYSVRVTLPKILPPSYRGTAVRFHYYVAVQFKWRPVGATRGTPVDEDPKQRSAGQLPQAQEVRIPFRVWTYPNSSGLTEEEIGAEDHYGIGGIVPTAPLHVEMRWREKSARARWVVNAEATSGAEDEEVSQQDETATAHNSVFGRHEHRLAERIMSLPGGRFSSSSQKPTPATATVTELDKLAAAQYGEEGEEGEAGQKERPAEPGRNSRVLGSGSEGAGEGEGEKRDAESVVKERIRSLPTPAGENGRGTLLYGEFESLLIAERERRSSLEGISWHGASASSLDEPESPLEAPPRGPFGNGDSSLARRDSMEEGTPPSPSAPVFARGRTYNIRIDDQVLVKFTPRNPQATYALGDVVSGTLTFSQDPGARQCLAVSVLLETHEVVNPLVLHPSRKAAGLRETPNAPLHLPAVQTEFHEVTAHLLSTHFLFTIPMDAPAAFATPLVSLQWILRFQFLASVRPKGGRGGAKGGREALLAGEEAETERGEWSMPIVVNAPLPRSHPLGVTGQVAFSNLRRESSIAENLGVRRGALVQSKPQGADGPLSSNPPLGYPSNKTTATRANDTQESRVNRALKFGSPSRRSASRDLDFGDS